MSSRRTAATTCLLLVGALLTTGLSTGLATAPADAAGRTTTAAAARAVPAADRLDAARKKKKPRKPAPPKVPGQPAKGYTMPPGSFFSFPNRSDAEAEAIRQRVLYTIQSVWGARRDPSTHVSGPGAGTIRIATWSFDDWAVARALVKAHARGVSVQVIAAQGKNESMRPWRYLRKKLKARPFPKGRPDLFDRSSFARVCRGACRGYGGTSHAKYFLFDNVGPQHRRAVVVNTSMNLTRFAYQNQWNEATVWWSWRVYRDFLYVFKQSRAQVRGHYHQGNFKGLRDYFFPNPSTNASNDPVMQLLKPVACTGATSGADAYGRTRVRVVQYATYGNRGVWIAKRLRQLWEAGCDVRMIYSIATRPVLRIMLDKHGRGPVPMRRSVITDSSGAFVKYNHSKWIAISGMWNRSKAAYLTLSGSANWSEFAYLSDEQMQQVASPKVTLAHFAAFDKTWAQRSSRKPAKVKGHVHVNGRTAAGGAVEVPAFGRGAYKYMDED